MNAVSAKEKREFLEYLIQLASHPDSASEAQKKLHQMLLRDTVEGKLYKYRSFDKNGYALQSVRNGTLHCSKPDVFNDPFDCKIGVTFQSVYKTLYGEEIDFIAKIYDLFGGVILGKVELQEIEVDKQQLVQKLLHNDILTDFVLNHRRVANIEEEMACLLNENSSVIVELLRTILEDERFSKHLRICARMFPEYMKQLDSGSILQLSQDDTTFEDYAKACGITEDEDEIDLALRMSKRINPKLDSAIKDVDRFLTDAERKVNETMGNTFLVGCLCTDFKNRLMWSHYADSHKGFCIEYDFSQTQELLPYPIYYSKERPLIPWKAALDNSLENVADATAALMLGVLTKDSEWSYENEWRVLVNASQTADVKMPSISCLYLGANISEGNKQKILKIANALGIPVKQMKIDRGTYALHAEDIPPSAISTK